MMLPLGVVIVAIIVLPWYAAIYERHGWGYIESFILRDNISRFTEPVWGPRRSIFFYLPVFAGDLFPWSVFLVAALWPGVKKIAAKFRRIQTDESQNEDASTQRIELLPVIWLMVIVAFFSVSRNKEDLYILPAYPAAAAVVGALLARLDFHRKTINATTCLLGSITAIAGAAVLYAFNSEAMPYRIAGATAIGATLLAGGLIVVTLVVMKKQFAALAASLLAVIVGNYFFVVAALPDFERYKPVRPFCEVIAGQASEDALIGYFRLASPSMTFYLRRQIFEYYEEDELRRALSSGREVYCLMTQADYQQMKDTLPAPTYVLAVRPLFQVKLKTILERKEIPQAVLISNRDQTGVSR
jgi:4-amino-4-deoxy-L-arabinose transferase-like glycosyltransferase